MTPDPDEALEFAREIVREATSVCHADEMSAVRAVLTLLARRDGAASETGWLIEWPEYPAWLGVTHSGKVSRPGILFGGSDSAIRFARESDARVAAALLGLEGMKFTEHVWCHASDAGEGRA